MLGLFAFCAFQAKAQTNIQITVSLSSAEQAALISATKSLNATNSTQLTEAQFLRGFVQQRTLPTLVAVEQNRQQRNFLTLYTNATPARRQEVFILLSQP